MPCPGFFPALILVLMPQARSGLGHIVAFGNKCVKSLCFAIAAWQGMFFVNYITQVPLKGCRAV